MAGVANGCNASNPTQFPTRSPGDGPGRCRLHESASRSAVAWGAPNYRAALGARQSRCTGLPLDTGRHLVVTYGSTEAMRLVMMTALGDTLHIYSYVLASNARGPLDHCHEQPICYLGTLME